MHHGIKRVQLRKWGKGWDWMREVTVVIRKMESKLMSSFELLTLNLLFEIVLKKYLIFESESA